MKKLLVTVCCLLILSGCTSSSEDLPEQIRNQLSQWSTSTITSGSNMNKYYYSYYLPLGIGRRDSNELSEVFVKQGYRLIMNFDPSAIVNLKFYEDKEERDSASQDKGLQAPTMDFIEQKTMYQGSYVASNAQSQNYILQVVENNGQYLLFLDGTIAKLYTYVPAAEVTSSLRVMMSLLSSIEFNETEILEDFSIKSLDETRKRNLDYTIQNLPSSGSLNELLDEKQPNIGVGDSTE